MVVELRNWDWLGLGSDSSLCPRLRFRQSYSPAHWSHPPQPDSYCRFFSILPVPRGRSASPPHLDTGRASKFHGPGFEVAGTRKGMAVQDESPRPAGSSAGSSSQPASQPLGQHAAPVRASSFSPGSPPGESAMQIDEGCFRIQTLAGRLGLNRKAGAFDNETS